MRVMRSSRSVLSVRRKEGGLAEVDLLGCGGVHTGQVSERRAFGLRDNRCLQYRQLNVPGKVRDQAAAA